MSTDGYQIEKQKGRLKKQKRKDPLVRDAWETKKASTMVTVLERHIHLVSVLGIAGTVGEAVMGQICLYLPTNMEVAEHDGVDSFFYYRS